MLLPARGTRDEESVKVSDYDERAFAPFFLPQFLKEAGFCNVQAEDRTAQFIQLIETELERAEAIKEEFIEVQVRVETIWLTSLI